MQVKFDSVAEHGHPLVAQYERAMKIKENAFGVDHINTADTIMNIGNTYSPQGKYEEAIAQYERALKIFEHRSLVDRRIGSIHQNIAKSLLKRFFMSTSADDPRPLILYHLRLSALTTTEQDPQLGPRFEILRTTLVFFTNDAIEASKLEVSLSFIL